MNSTTTRTPWNDFNTHQQKSMRDIMDHVITQYEGEGADALNLIAGTKVVYYSGNYAQAQNLDGIINAGVITRELDADQCLYVYSFTPHGVAVYLSNQRNRQELLELLATE